MKKIFVHKKVDASVCMMSMGRLRKIADTGNSRLPGFFDSLQREHPEIAEELVCLVTANGLAWFREGITTGADIVAERLPDDVRLMLTIDMEVNPK